MLWRAFFTWALLFPVAMYARAAQDAAPTIVESSPETPLPELRKIRRPWNPTVFSEGYVLGQIVQPTSEGLLIKFFHAEVLLGVNSVPSGLTDQDCLEGELKNIRGDRTLVPGTISYTQAEQSALDHCTEEINPFYVSSYSTAWQDQAAISEKNRLSLLRVKAYLIHPFLKTAYVIKQIIPVNSQNEMQKAFMDQSKQFRLSKYVHYGISQLEGRVVVATMDGIVRKRYHLVLQVGNGGGRFVHLDVPNRVLFDYIVKTMRTGLPVRVYYFTWYGLQALPSNLLHGYETNTRVFRVDVLQEIPET